jgi:hypothetical protein
MLVSQLRLGLPYILSFEVFRPKFCTRFRFDIFVIHAPPIPFLDLITIILAKCTVRK